MDRGEVRGQLLATHVGRVRALLDRRLHRDVGGLVLLDLGPGVSVRWIITISVVDLLCLLESEEVEHVVNDSALVILILENLADLRGRLGGDEIIRARSNGSCIVIITVGDRRHLEHLVKALVGIPRQVLRAIVPLASKLDLLVAQQPVATRV